MAVALRVAALPTADLGAQHSETGAIGALERDLDHRPAVVAQAGEVEVEGSGVALRAPEAAVAGVAELVLDLGVAGRVVV
jgi:hypothetical protein